MANITNQEAVAYCNNQVRQAADKLAQAYYFCKGAYQQWNALDMANKITNNANDNIVDSAYGTDGTDGDGRPVITGADVYNLITRCSDLVTDYEANSNAELNTIINIAVNPQQV